MARAGGLLALAVLLSACDESAGGLTFPSFGRALPEAQLAGGALLVTPPEGWCVEPRSLRNAANESFAMVAGCRALTGGQGTATPRGYATIAVGAQTDAANTAELFALVTQGARVLDQTARGPLTFARLDSEDGPIWRGVVIVGGWPVSLAVFGEDPALSGDQGASLLQALALGMLVRAPETPQSTPETASEGSDAAEATETEGVDVGGVLRRLLN